MGAAGAAISFGARKSLVSDSGWLQHKAFTQKLTSSVVYPPQARRAVITDPLWAPRPKPRELFFANAKSRIVLF